MANNKIDRINKEIAKTREKITEYQNKLKGLEAQKTEAENLEIVQLRYATYPAGIKCYAVRRRYSRHERRTRYRSGRLRRTGGQCR